MSASTNSLSEPGRIVLDTQAVLDCWYFRDPAFAAWEPLLEAGSWRWMATAWMRQELAWVLERGFGPRWPGDAAAPLAAFDRLAEVKPAPVRPLAGALRCSDPDDQPFIDLAVDCRASHLVTRDRALLKLGRRAARLHGLQVVRPGDWPPRHPARMNPAD